MKYNSMFLLRRRTLTLKGVVLFIVLWFMVALLTTYGGTRNSYVAPSMEYQDPEPLKMAKLNFGMKKSKSYGNNNVSDDVRVAPGLDTGPGELGQPVVLPKNISEETRIAVSEGWKNHAFNQYVSDLISTRRKLPDPRDEWCKEPGRYLEDLPQSSVVICFYNEAWSVLLRTVHSVLDRSPAHLLREIILVDDFSDLTHLMQKLDNYMSTIPKVKIIRATRREGLIRARLLGARYVSARVLIYLDSHCECTEGWLEPLLDRIARNKTTVVSPVIDNLDSNTLEYHYSSRFDVGGFNWLLQFTWHPVPARERARHQNAAEPVWSPTIAGGLFAIDKEFFQRLGTYDSGFDIWGGENLELSFKTWMCGGTLEIVPCSHVGHIFRKRSPYIWKTSQNVVEKNLVRLAEVWLDDYAKYFYQSIFNYRNAGFDKGDYGDITSRKQLRKNLGCKSFEWYLKNVYPELLIPGDSIAYGEIANPHTQMCLDSAVMPQDLTYPVNIWPCHGKHGNQFWMYSKNGEIRRDEMCLDYSGHNVILYNCLGVKGNQLWLYDPNTKLLKHGSSEKCMTITRDKEEIIMETCSDTEPRQMWVLENFNAEKLSPLLMDD